MKDLSFFIFMLRSTPFQQLIHPVPEDVFFRDHWEKKPLVIQGNSNFADVYSLTHLKQAIGNQKMLYTINLNVCKCIDHVKHMLEQFPTEVSLFEVQQYFEKHQATLQVLQPQQHTPQLAELLSEMESFFGCLVGSNVYITPPNSKGLAPHYDDVEVFIIQLEGKKQWKIHKPINELPSSCSGDLLPDEIGDPFMEFELKKGDVLYFPRGWIHHAETSDDISTHVTISTYQQHSYSRLLNLAIPIALRELSENNVEYRRGLPLRVFSAAGFANALSQTNNPDYDDLVQTSEELLSGVKEAIGLALHEAVDLMSVDFMESRLPPSKSFLERALGKFKDLMNEDGCYGPFPDSADMTVRLVDPSVVRLVIDDGQSSEEDEYSDESDLDDSGCADIRYPFSKGETESSDEEEPPTLVSGESDDESSSDDELENEVQEPTALLFYSTKNDASAHMGPVKNNPNCLRFALDMVAPISYLLQSYPKFVKIKNIPRMDNQELESIQGMVVALWSCGIIICDRSKKRKRSPEKEKSRKVRKLK